MKNVRIFDTTLRDGEQSPGASLNTNEKVAIARQLAKLGVDVIEAGFPMASDDDFLAVQRIAREVRGPFICGLARADKRDIDRAWDAVRESENPMIHTFIATSDVHLEKKLKRSQEDVIEMVREMVSYACSLCDNVEFSPEDCSRTGTEFMLEVISTAIDAGAKVINIPDTVGYAEPDEFGRRIRLIFEQLGTKIDENNVLISVHCHNDLGNAVANSLAAVKNGADQVECTINGIGERAGNASLEEVVMNLVTRSDFFAAETNINTRELFRTSQMVSKLTGLDVQRNKAIVGRNAFAHEAGIHQHGVICDRNTYEIMRAEEVGWVGENIVIGKHSGKHAVLSVLKDEGYELSDDEVALVTMRVKELADREKNVSREDVTAIANDVLENSAVDEYGVKMEDIEVTIRSKGEAWAAVKLNVNGESKEMTMTGVGPVNALSKAILAVTDPTLALSEYMLKAVTGGTDALADVNIAIRDSNGKVFRARALNQDIVMASAYAIIKGINKAMMFKKRNQ